MPISIWFLRKLKSEFKRGNKGYSKYEYNCLERDTEKKEKKKKEIGKCKKTENRLDRLAEARETLTEEDQKQKDKHGPARAGENSGAGAGEGGSRAGRTARAGDACVH